MHQKFIFRKIFYVSIIYLKYNLSLLLSYKKKIQLFESDINKKRKVKYVYTQMCYQLIDISIELIFVLYQNINVELLWCKNCILARVKSYE